MIPAWSVSAYLRTLPRVRTAKAVRVTMGTESFLGAYYTQANIYTAGMDAVTRGQKRIGDESYPDRRFYLLGETPKMWRNAGEGSRGESRLIWTYDGEDWTGCGGYTPHLIAPFGRGDFRSEFGGGDIRPFHPFGYWFDISMWPTNTLTPHGEPFGRVDKYDDRPRKRIPLNVEFLGEA